MNKDVFLIDFDGTIAINDTTHVLAKHFVPKAYEKYRQDFREGKVNVRNFIYDLLSMLPADEKAFKSAIQKEIIIDPSFKWFSQHIENFYIVSSGTQMNVLAALETIGLKIDESRNMSNHLSFNNERIVIDFPFYDEENGVAKDKIVQGFKNNGKNVIFVGDGPSDYEAAKYADLVFGRKETRLVKKCADMGLECYEFSDFYELFCKYQSLKTN